MHLCAGVSLFCIGCPSILVPLIYLVQVGQEGQDSLRQIVILCNYGAIRAVISHRVKLNNDYYESINQPTRAPVIGSYHPLWPLRQFLPSLFSLFPCEDISPPTGQASGRHRLSLGGYNYGLNAKHKNT